MSENALAHKKYLINSYNFVDLTLTSGQGSYLFSDKGDKYLDFTSGIGVNLLGHANPEIVNTIKNQAESMLHISNLYLNTNTIEAAKKLVAITGMKKVFFSNSGAESNEGAIKIARKYSFDKYGIDRGNILTLKQSFHGRTLATLKATGQDKFHKYFFPLPEGFIYAKANDLNDLYSKIDDSICAIMIEGIQGEGGVLPLDFEFVDAISNVCKKNDILLIVDEVQTGVGRTGKFLMKDYFNIDADIVTLAKGLGGGIPIGAIICGEKVENTIGVGEHGSTFGGNPLATAVASTILDKFLNSDFIDNINKKSELLFSELNLINSDNIIDIRGKGLMIGIEVKGNLLSYVNKARERGLLILTAGESTLRLLPPLNISIEEIKIAIKILKEIL